MKKIIKLKESDIKNIVKKIINEQGFDGNGFPEGDEIPPDDYYSTVEPEERSNVEHTDEELAINRFESTILDLMDMGYAPFDLKQRIDDINMKYFRKHSEMRRQERTNRNKPEGINENKKVIRLKESDLRNIVKNIITEKTKKK